MREAMYEGCDRVLALSSSWLPNDDQVTPKGIVDHMLSMFGLDPTDTNYEQLAVFIEAMQLFQNREAKYGSQWKQYGVMDLVSQMRHKMARINTLYWDAFPDISDDAIEDPDSPMDLINYTAFLLRCLQDGNIKGTT